ncbi:hypothetical protein AQ490_11895 [Wenjunlia vitaminophila]|uniref:Aminotransferase class I/classII large domain-containing protein n=1 Tax=Wenjunlia vitaminophila TaxID=76728 RepID=A0A0T6LL14_WENVI|nr:aminotransferase class I/II-fold pyridoxal phosphate-dependent enzyme [Wenjunlia vitaminophila]KRV46575.1 hypothetical protein AQ490_11895 [Wenjunlia vitaminophila]
MKLSSRVRRSRAPAVPTVAAQAAALRAAGRRVISLAADEPDFAVPEPVLEAARRACATSANHRHASPPAGWPRLRAAAAQALSAPGGTALAEDQVVVTNGARQALLLACAVTVDAGDEVLLPVPSWPGHSAAVTHHGGVPVPVPTTAETAYKVTPQSLEAAWTPRTTALLLGSPANPTGTVYTPAELRAIAAWAAAHDLWVISDEVYQHFVYGRDTPFLALRDAHESMPERCLTVHGVSRTYAMTGWRVGWLAGPRPAIAAATALRSHLPAPVSNVAQAAALAALDCGTSHLSPVLAALDRRRTLTHQVLGGLRGVQCVEPRGGYFCLLDVRGLLGKEIHGHVPRTSRDLAEYLLNQVLVAVAPGEEFDAPGHLRLSYALADEPLVNALALVQRALAHGVHHPAHH